MGHINPTPNSKPQAKVESRERHGKAVSTEARNRQKKVKILSSER